MNVRFARNEVRVRISRDELAGLIERGELSEATRFPGGRELRFTVRTNGAKVVALEPSGLCVWLGRDELRQLQSAPPAKDLGIYGEVEVPGGVLRYSVEVDLFSGRGNRGG